MKALTLLRGWLVAVSLTALSFGALATPQTDDIRALTATQNANTAAYNAAVSNKLAEIDALPSGGAHGPLVWPAATNLLGGTAPAIISYPSGFPGDSGGYPEPSKGRRMAAANFPGMCHAFGDSTLQDIPGSFFSPFAENWGIGGRTLRMLVNDWHNFPPMAQGGCAIFLGGVNEAGQTQYYGSRVGAVSTILYIYANQIKNWITGKWFFMHLLPVVNTHPDAADYNAMVAQVNAGMANALAGSAATVVVIPTNPDMLEPDGSLKASMAGPDKQHKSALGSYMHAIPVYSAIKAAGINP